MKNNAKKNILSAQKSAHRAKRNAALMSALLTIAAMLCLFLLIQSVVMAQKKKAIKA